MAEIKKVLVANRGEIALRVFRACQEMGIRTVAVCSEADRDAWHVAVADEVVEIGPPEASNSYLVIDRIIEAARQTGADAIHPGYGFLSERPEFVEACESAGIIFIGPPAGAMRKLGEKIDAKQLAVECGVAITPGFFEPGASPERLKSEAERIGYPVMLKASAGGGGRGMRIVRDPAEFDRECRLAMEEAQKAFGSDVMMVEKLVERPRHIEAQLLADSQGEVAVLYERECSLQRRHQKVLEEAPSPVASANLWNTIRESCQKLAKAAGYRGAGTVEFMYDEVSGELYFLEVNARLQVEHPVTEMITGVDLVRQQIRIAEGKPLEVSDSIRAGRRDGISGHAIEARIIAEDPGKGFLPSIGRLLAVEAPFGPGIRFDGGYRAGDEVSRHYDSLLGKLIVHGATRGEAIARLDWALRNTHVLGVQTNISFLLDVIRHPDFASGKFDTGFLGREFGTWQVPTEVPGELGDLLGFATIGTSVSGTVASGPASTAWSSADGFRNAR